MMHGPLNVKKKHSLTHLCNGGAMCSALHVGSLSHYQTPTWASPLQNFTIYFYTILMELFEPSSQDTLSCNFNNISHFSCNTDTASKFVHTLPYLDEHTELLIEPTNTSEELGTVRVSDRTI
jgi:hypothetical protein